MVEGSGDDSSDGGRADEGTILSPHELDITESEHVEQIDEGRFVVSPDARTGGSGAASQGNQSQGGNQQGGQQPTNQSRGGQPQGGQPQGRKQPQSRGGRGANTGSNPPQSASRGRGTERSQSGQNLTEAEVRQWLRQKYERSSSKYAFDVTAQFDGNVSQRRLASNDLITVFESLMLWYAQEVDSSMPVEEVLGILLMESNVPVRYPPESVRNLIKSTDLGPDDTIADLLEAVQDDDGVQL